MRRGRRGGIRQQMNSWLEDYEKRRGQINSNSDSNSNYDSSNYSKYKKLKEPRQPNPNWISDKYDLQSMTQETWIPELQCTYGGACSAFKKLWKKYKILGDKGEQRSDVAYNIVKIEAALGMEKSQFPELEHLDLDLEFPETGEMEEMDGWEENQENQNLTPLERQLKREEEIEGDRWDTNYDFSVTNVLEDDDW